MEAIMRRTLFFLVLFGLAILTTTCNLFLWARIPNTPSNINGPETLPEPVFTPEILWETEIESAGTFSDPLYTDGYVYIQETSLPSENDFSRLLKIRLSDGEIVWKTADLPVRSTGNVIKHGQYLYIPVFGRLYVYSDSDGELLATIRFDENVADARKKGLWYQASIMSGPYLLWGNLNTDDRSQMGLMRLDTRHIDFSRPCDEEQVIVPGLVWSMPEGAPIWTQMVEEAGIVYLLTSNRDYVFGSGVGYLAAIEAATCRVIWQREMPHTRGDRTYSLAINGDKLHVLDMAPSCYNKNTGAALYENDLRTQIMNKDYCLAASYFLRGITVYNNRLYYCTGMHSNTASQEPGLLPEMVKNVICLDADTGALVWGDLVPKSVTFETFPVISEGKAYVVTNNGLRVYDADTGTLLGVDYTVESAGAEVNWADDTMFVYLNEDADPTRNRSRLTAIRTN
jgi:outer membrane protein assembly factor BamB